MKALWPRNCCAAAHHDFCNFAGFVPPCVCPSGSTAPWRNTNVGVSQPPLLFATARGKRVQIVRCVCVVTHCLDTCCHRTLHEYRR